MNWLEVCEHPSLRNLPFKIELDQLGRIIMSPLKVSHSFYQGKLSGLLYQHLNNGEVLIECAIHTKKGTKVADVAWVFLERFNQVRNQVECLIAPEICIEVLSESNSKKEMSLKKPLYFDKGAQEVWICDLYGKMTFYNKVGALKKSELAPNFPHAIA
jgi:Uma2 family endonuclease